VLLLRLRVALFELLLKAQARRFHNCRASLLCALFDNLPFKSALSFLATIEDLNPKRTPQKPKAFSLPHERKKSIYEQNMVAAKKTKVGQEQQHSELTFCVSKRQVNLIWLACGARASLRRALGALRVRTNQYRYAKRAARQLPDASASK